MDKSIIWFQFNLLSTKKAQFQANPMLYNFKNILIFQPKPFIEINPDLQINATPQKFIFLTVTYINSISNRFDLEFFKISMIEILIS